MGWWSTSTSTPLFFAQAVGRFVRARKRGETASVFLPSTGHLLGLAAEMEVQRDHVLGRPVSSDDDIFAADDKVVMRWTAVGTFQNEFMGFQPTGESGDPVTGMNIDRYDEDGKLAETWGQWDTLTLMRDIGAIPDAAAAGTQG